MRYLLPCLDGRGEPTPSTQSLAKPESSLWDITHLITSKKPTSEMNLSASPMLTEKHSWRNSLS
jgi:hypothetical protein